MEETVVESTGPVFNPTVGIQRYTTVRDLLYKLPGIKKVADFGCSSGKFVKYLKNLPFVNEIACVDLNYSCLDDVVYISRPIAWDYLFKRHQPLSIKIYKGDVSEEDCRLRGFDAITCIELIEHLEPNALKLLPNNVFGYIHPKVAIFTTPNSEFNVLFPNLKGFRHWDHKFEWNRNEFRDWCMSITNQYPEYTVYIQGIGDTIHDRGDIGSCSQVAVFQLKDKARDLYRSPNIGENTQPYVLVAENNYPGRDHQSTTVTSDTENNDTT